MVKCMGMEKCFGKIKENFKENMLMIKNMEMAFSHLEMGQLLRGIGIMVNNMEHKPLNTQMGR